MKRRAISLLLAATPVRRVNRYEYASSTMGAERFRMTGDPLRDAASLLDHSMILYGAGLADGNSHQHDHLPAMLAGGGAIQSGRFLQVAPQTPITNLYVSMLARMRLDIEQLGDSTGKLSDLGGLA